MKTVNIHKAKTHLSELIQDVLNGEEVVIAKYGTPLVKLEPYSTPIKRKPGFWKNRIVVADDFDELPDDIEKVFRGEVE